eukprot:29528-Chlamydomonas_euryale.AAC.1
MAKLSGLNLSGVELLSHTAVIAAVVWRHRQRQHWRGRWRARGRSIDAPAAAARPPLQLYPQHLLCGNLRGRHLPCAPCRCADLGRVARHGAVLRLADASGARRRRARVRPRGVVRPLVVEPRQRAHTPKRRPLNARLCRGRRRRRDRCRDGSRRDAGLRRRAWVRRRRTTCKGRQPGLAAGRRRQRRRRAGHIAVDAAVALLRRRQPV